MHVNTHHALLHQVKKIVKKIIEGIHQSNFPGKMKNKFPETCKGQTNLKYCYFFPVPFNPLYKNISHWIHKVPSSRKVSKMCIPML